MQKGTKIVGDVIPCGGSVTIVVEMVVVVVGAATSGVKGQFASS